MDPLKRVAAVVPTYNSAGVVGPCLESLRNINSIVVDNASDDDTVNRVNPFAPRASLVQAPGNLGYGSAANLGLRQVETEFALLLNPDIRLRPGAVERLVEAADRYPNAALFSPRLWNPDGRIQFGHRQFGAPFLARVGKVGGQPPAGDCCTIYLSGAALLFRMAAFESIGLFDEEIFLFYEDDDLCLRIRDAGWSLVHVHEAQADHGAGESSGSGNDLEWFRRWHTGWSRAYMEKKYRGATACRAWVLARTPKYAFKAAGYRLLGNKAKYDRYSGELNGMWAFLTGRRQADKKFGQD